MPQNLNQYKGHTTLPTFLVGLPPTSTTLAGIAPTGALLIDNSTGILYQNSGTEDVPVWTILLTPGSAVAIASVNLTSAQIKALFTTPITIVPAPASGSIIQVLSLMYSLTYGSTTYVIPSGDVGLYYGNAAGKVIDLSPDTDLIATSSKVNFPAISAISDTSAATFNGLPAVLAASAANPTTGDGTFRVTVTYIVSAL